LNPRHNLFDQVWKGAWGFTKKRITCLVSSGQNHRRWHQAQERTIYKRSTSVELQGRQSILHLLQEDISVVFLKDPVARINTSELEVHEKKGGEDLELTTSA
jgi:hypothetical protein